MAKLTDKSAIVTLSLSDLIHVVDVDDTTSDPLGTSKKASISQIIALAGGAPTHTGEVTGATVLTVDKTAITNKTTVTGVSGDFVLISDTSDGGNLKKVDVVDFLGGAADGNGIYSGSGSLTAATTVSQGSNTLEFNVDNKGGSPFNILSLTETGGGSIIHTVGYNSSAKILLNGLLTADISLDTSAKSYINTGFNFGVGTTTPTLRLSVEGVAGIAGLADFSSATGRVVVIKDYNDHAIIDFSNSTAPTTILGRFYTGGNSWFNNVGNFGFGTITPTEKLEVVGSIKMVDGNQALGKVITSDANGVGSWQNLAGDGNGIFDAANNGGVVPTTYAFNIQNTLAIRGVTSVPILTCNTATGVLIGGSGVNAYNLTLETSSNTALILKRQSVDMLKVTYNAANPTLRMYNSLNGEVVNIAATAFAAYHTYFISPSNFGIGTSTPTDKLQVVGTVDATRYKVNGVAGANFSGAVTSITVVDGLVTIVS